MIWHDMIWYDMIWYDMIWYDMIWYDMVWSQKNVWKSRSHITNSIAKNRMIHKSEKYDNFEYNVKKLFSLWYVNDRNRNW